MDRALIAILCLNLFQLFAPRMFAAEAVARIEIPQTGESARVYNPACASGFNYLSAADVVLKMGAAAVDSAIGYPITDTILNKLPPENKNWLKVRFGIHNGPSFCATQCVALPRDANAKLEACMTETGGNGGACYTGASDYNGGGDHKFGRVEKFSTESTRDTTIFCATGKNWSHNRNRWLS